MNSAGETRRRLVVNADDFGFTRDVNAGIIEAFQNGILRAATLMANGDAYEDAVQLARLNPGLDIGCHLVLIGGRSLLAPHQPFPASVPELVKAVVLRRLSIEKELAAQVRRVLDAGLHPTHLDTHKHTHLLPQVLRAVCRISRRFGIPWVRRPFDFPMRGGAGHIPWAKRAASRSLELLRPHFRAVLPQHGCRATDHFVGFQITGRFGTRELVRLIHLLPTGTTELMCHPGRCRSELRGAPTRLKKSREDELEALVAPETRAAVAAARVDLVSYRDL